MSMTPIAAAHVRRASEDLAQSALPHAPVWPAGPHGPVWPARADAPVWPAGPDARVAPRRTARLLQRLAPALGLRRPRVQPAPAAN